ncbi:MAG: hypothetical protein ACLS5O_10310 [[Clostridium] leptum]
MSSSLVLDSLREIFTVSACAVLQMDFYRRHWNIDFKTGISYGLESK